jgi:cell surface protein SprA
MVGVVNETDATVFGRIFLDELRMTGVKHEKGQAMRVSGSIDFADLLKINSSYSLEDADFHRLQERLGTGSSTESFSFSTSFYPHKFLPSQWGINTPITINYSSNISSPKFKPGTDILLGSIDETPEELKSISESISFSTGFNKTSRSDNWFMQYTVDKIDVDFSIKKTTKSSTTVENEETIDSDFSANYQVNFNKDNYISPFKIAEDVPLIVKYLSETRWYFSPEKIKATIKIDDHDKISFQRSGTVTQDTSMGMTRTFLINYKLTESLQSNYNNSIQSNLTAYMSDKFGFIRDMNPGVIKSLTENFSNTFSPNFMDWLKPKFTYNPKYTWNLVNQTDSIPSANVSNNSKLTASFNFSPKELVELVYKPENSAGSSRSSSRRGRRRTSRQEEQKQKRLEIKNPTLKAIFNSIHKVSSKVSKVNFNYNFSSTHSHSNIFADLSPSYWYRLGLWSDPFQTSSYYNLGDGQVGSYSHSYTQDYKISTSINLTSKLTLTNMEYKNSVTTNLSSSSDPTVNITETFLPLGLTGNDGIPIFGWSINLSGFEKYGFFKNWLKSLSFSHTYKGERTESFKNDEQQKLDFTRYYSPLFGLVAKTKGRNSVTFKLTYNMKLDINNTGTQTEREYKNQLTSSLDYKKSGGLNLPIFFFRDFVIENDIDFRLDVSYDKNYTLFSYVNASDINEFDLTSFSNSISIKPRINYSFTRYVDGDVYFNYIISDNNSVGKKTEKNFGFTVKIKIQG